MKLRHRFITALLPFALLVADPSGAAQQCNAWPLKLHLQSSYLYFRTMEELDAVWAIDQQAQMAYPWCLLSPFRAPLGSEYATYDCTQGAPAGSSSGGKICAFATINQQCSEGQGFPTSIKVLDYGNILSTGVTCTSYFLRAQPPSEPRCSSCDENSVAEPINPASGGMFDTKVDASTPSSLSFKRFYNSTDTSSANISSGWEHSYGRKVVTQYSTVKTQIYLASASTSSQYSDPSSACTSGFAEIKSNVPQWATALASYSNGNCVLTKGGAYIGTIPVSSAGGAFAPPPTPVAYDVIRDDGQLIRFIVDPNGVLINPPGNGFKLQTTPSSFIITDSNDNVEQYDTNGKLLTVTSRTGVVQTTSYDGSGRLSGVSDSFGHQLNFGYDAQGHLSTVTRP